MFTRLISIVPAIVPGAITRIHRADAVALTIDDGPHDTATLSALRTLDKHSLRATFFFNGAEARHRRAIVEEIHGAGHDIGNHGFDHESLLFRSKERIHWQLRETNEILADIIREPIRFFRPPFGHWNPMHAPVLHSLDLCLILWSRMPGEFRAHFDEKRMRPWLVTHIAAGDILVLHANEKTEHIIAPLLTIVAAVLLERQLETTQLSAP